MTNYTPPPHRACGHHSCAPQALPGPQAPRGGRLQHGARVDLPPVAGVGAMAGFTPRVLGFTPHRL